MWVEGGYTRNRPHNQRSFARFIASASWAILFIHRSTSSLFSFLTLSRSCSAMDICRFIVIMSSCTFCGHTRESAFSPLCLGHLLPSFAHYMYTSTSLRFSRSSCSRSRSFVVRAAFSAVRLRTFFASSLCFVRSVWASSSACFARSLRVPFERRASASWSWSCAMVGSGEEVLAVPVVGEGGMLFDFSEVVSLLFFSGAVLDLRTWFSASRAATWSESWEPG